MSGSDPANLVWLLAAAFMALAGSGIADVMVSKAAIWPVGWLFAGLFVALMLLVTAMTIAAAFAVLTIAAL